MEKYMVLKVFDHPYEDIQPCEYNGKTVFDSVGEAKMLCRSLFWIFSTNVDSALKTLRT